MWKNTSQCLSINQIEVFGPIGVYDFEKNNQNKFLLSVNIWGDFSKSMLSDEIKDTLDYQLIANIAKNILTKEGNLIEHAARNIANEISLLNFDMTKIQVLLQKLNPHMQCAVDNTSFELVIEKS